MFTFIWLILCYTLYLQKDIAATSIKISMRLLLLLFDRNCSKPIRNDIRSCQIIVSRRTTSRVTRSFNYGGGRGGHIFQLPVKCFRFTPKILQHELARLWMLSGQVYIERGMTPLNRPCAVGAVRKRNLLSYHGRCFTDVIS